MSNFPLPFLSAVSRFRRTTVPLKFLFVIWLVYCGAFTLVHAANGSDARVRKVLPHYIDLQGKHTLSPSLFERDAYQNFLRRNPEKRGGLKLDVQYSSKSSGQARVLRLELRGIQNNQTIGKTIEIPLKDSNLFGGWASVVVKGDAYKELGELLAWKASILEGKEVIAEQQSFLW